MKLARETILTRDLESLLGVEQDSRRQAKARRIVEVATELFKEHGFHKTSVRMIARAAGVSMGNLYQYIQQKEDLIYLAAAIPTADFRASLFPAPVEGSVRQRITLLFHRLLDVVDRHREVMQMLYLEARNLPELRRAQVVQMRLWIVDQFSELIDRGIALGEIEPCNAHLLGLDRYEIAHMWSRRAADLVWFQDVEGFKREQTSIVMRMIPFRHRHEAELAAS